VSAFDLGALDGDEVGLGYLLPLLDCNDDKRRVDFLLQRLRVASLSPAIEPSTRQRVVEVSERWRTFLGQHVDFPYCFGRQAVKEVRRFKEQLEVVLAQAEKEAARPVPVVPLHGKALAPSAVVLLPVEVQREEESHVLGTSLLVMGGIAGAVVFHRLRRHHQSRRHKDDR
jgi:hypothetical protein